MADLPRYWMDEGRSSRYVILDRARGRGMPIARVDDAEMAARIVRLLNADQGTDTK